MPLGIGATPTFTGIIATGATPFKFKGSALDPDARDYNIAGATFPGSNGTGVRNNTVFNIGYNVASNGAREDITDAALRIGFESYYVADGTSNQEFHVESIDTSGVPHRIITAKVPRDGSSGAPGLTFQSNTLTLNTYAGVNVGQFNLSSNNASFLSGFHIFFLGNNTPVLYQRNAANTNDLPLAYYDADDRYRIPTAMVSVGTTPTGGTYPNVFAKLQATSAAANGFLLSASAAAVTGDFNLFQFQGSTTSGSVIGTINNTINASASDVRVILQVAGTSAGDPHIQYRVVSGASWYVGIDNSDNDKFKWSYNNTIGNADKMTLDLNGSLTLAGQLNLIAGTTALSSLNLAAGVAKTSPANGDVWFDGTNLKIQIGGVTKTVTIS